VMMTLRTIQICGTKWTEEYSCSQGSEVSGLGMGATKISMMTDNQRVTTSSTLLPLIAFVHTLRYSGAETKQEKANYA
jgi:hypothetical protein